MHNRSARAAGGGRGNQGTRLVAAVAAAAAAGLIPAGTAQALDVFWNNAAGGTFSTGSNWSNGGGLPPDGDDFAHFQLNSATPPYTINFTNSPTTRGMYVHSNNVTWELNGNTYTQSTSTAFDPFLVGQNAGEVGSLTINNGNVNTSIAGGSFN